MQFTISHLLLALSLPQKAFGAPIGVQPTCPVTPLGHDEANITIDVATSWRMLRGHERENSQLIIHTAHQDIQGAGRNWGIRVWTSIHNVVNLQAWVGWGTDRPTRVMEANVPANHNDYALGDYTFYFQVAGVVAGTLVHFIVDDMNCGRKLAEGDMAIGQN